MDECIHIVPADFRSSCRSWRTFLIILFAPLSGVLQRATGCDWFVVKLCPFHFTIMAPTVLTGTVSSLKILL